MIPACRRWRREDQEFKVMTGYIVSSEQPRARWDSQKAKHREMMLNFNASWLLNRSRIRNACEETGHLWMQSPILARTMSKDWAEEGVSWSEKQCMRGRVGSGWLSVSVKDSKGSERRLSWSPTVQLRRKDEASWCTCHSPVRASSQAWSHARMAFGPHRLLWDGGSLMQII